jgi:AAA+ ATPase superfamily predicted ATPase
VLDVGLIPDLIRGWWNRRGDEIDIVTLNDERKIAFFGEVKWSKNKVDTDVLEALISKSDLVKEVIGYE